MGLVLGIPMKMLRWAEINLNAIQENVKAIKGKVGNRKIIAVVKANAYGHGVLPISRAIADFVDMFAVATLEEAIELRNAGITLPILNLFCILPDQAEAVSKYNITQTVCKLSVCEALSSSAKQMDVVAKVHIKINTGMNRIGIHYTEATSFIERVCTMPNLLLEGIFTHFARADEADKSYTHTQLKRFNVTLSECRSKNNDLFFVMLNRKKQKIASSVLLHASNSAAILDHPEAYFNAVRPGLILYGVYPSAEVTQSIVLQPALNLKTRVTHLKNIKRGERISYGGTYTAPESTRIATLPIGYADGYRRSLSNVGEVLIRGVRAPVVGTVCMDQIMCDVGHISGVDVGDEVVLIGKQRNDEITADELATRAGTISYEIFCGLGRRVERVYL